MADDRSALKHERLDVGELLKAQLDAAYAAHLVADRRFDSLVRETPSGLPMPDGSLRIHQAGNEANIALRYYTLALQRFCDFTLSRIVPADLLRPE